MSDNLPVAHPAEMLEISPEALEVANCYLQLQDVAKVSDALDIPVEMVSELLQRKEIKAYINQVFFDTGFNNRFKLRKAVDAIIAKKFQEMDEAELGSSKDILEILAFSHKMTMETLQREIELEKLRIAKTPKTQTNIQINGASAPEAPTNYGTLIERLLAGNKPV